MIQQPYRSFKVRACLLLAHCSRMSAPHVREAERELKDLYNRSEKKTSKTFLPMPLW